MRMLSEAEENDDSPEVDWEDQQRINTFSKLNNRTKDLEDTLEQKKQQKTDLEDLEQDLELSIDEDPIMYKIGETFVLLPFPAAKRRLRADQASVDAEIATIHSQLEGFAEEMKALKVTLYGKFGSAINLD